MELITAEDEVTARIRELDKRVRFTNSEVAGAAQSLADATALRDDTVRMLAEWKAIAARLGIPPVERTYGPFGQKHSAECGGLKCGGEHCPPAVI